MAYLADAVDPMISGNWIIAVIGAVTTGAAAILAKRQGIKEGEERSVTIADQPISFSASSPNATQEELASLKRDIDGRLEKIEHALSEERRIARTANGNLHARIDKTTEAMAELKGELGQIGENVSRLLDLAMKRGRAGL